MIDTARSGYPADMLEAAHGSQGRIEAVAGEAVRSLEDYARARPLSAVMVALGIGFVLGWKLKPW